MSSKSWRPRSRNTWRFSARRVSGSWAIIGDELREVREKFAVDRRTEIVDWSGDMDDEDLIEREDMVVTVTSGGYIKRTPLADFRAQKRGGKGLSGMQTKEEDVVTTLFVANTHTQLLVLHHRWHGLQAENLALAAGWPDLQRQGDCEHPADPVRCFDCRDHAGGPPRG